MQALGDSKCSYIPKVWCDSVFSEVPHTVAANELPFINHFPAVDQTIEV